jgi:hypothetical protein
MPETEARVEVKPAPETGNVAAKGSVTIETKAIFTLDEKMLQCLNGQGLTVTSITVT